MSAQPAIALPAWAVRLIMELDESDRRAKQLTSTLTTEQLNWRANEGTWSIGQCLDHLCLTNETYVPAICTSLSDGAGVAVSEITLKWFARWFIRSYIAPSPQTKRARAPKKIVPQAHVEVSVLNRFLASNDAIRDLIRRSASYDVNRIRFKNPYVPVLRFTVGAGLEIISGHERRHLLQAERVKESSKFPIAGH